MKFLDSFRKLFSKKEDGTEKRREQIERTLNAKILADMEKEKAKKKLTLENFDKFKKQENEKEARKLIEVKRKERLQKEKASKQSAKKKLKTLSSNF